MWLFSIFLTPAGQAKRLFQVPFYRDCLNALREGGIVVAQSESPLLDLQVIIDLRADMQKADYAANSDDSVSGRNLPIRLVDCNYGAKRAEIR